MVKKAHIRKHQYIANLDPAIQGILVWVDDGEVHHLIIPIMAWRILGNGVLPAPVHSQGTPLIAQSRLSRLTI